MHGKLLVNQIVEFGGILERSVNKKIKHLELVSPLVFLLRQVFFLGGYNKPLYSLESFFCFLFLRMTF